MADLAISKRSRAGMVTMAAAEISACYCPKIEQC
jgi:hypothetical protein